ncbi:MAG: lipopolysaccharide biosynthesis protein, partial [Pedobacter sp.]
IMYPLSAYNLNILKVKGKSNLFLKLEIIKKIISVTGIICVFPFGIYGLLYLQLFFSFFSFYINSRYTARFIAYPIGKQLRDILPTLILAAATGAACYFLDYQFEKSFHFKDWLRIILTGLMYSVCYFSLGFLIKLPAIIDFKQIILKR